MKFKFSLRERAAILLAALLVVGPLSWPFLDYVWQSEINHKAQTANSGYYQAWQTYGAIAQAVAAFLTLGVVAFQAVISKRQAAISDIQTEIQRAQHALATRPRLIFRYAEMDVEGPPGNREPRVFYRITNIGGSTAHITKFFCAARTYNSSFGAINLDQFLRNVPEKALFAGASLQERIGLNMPASQFNSAWRQIEEALRNGTLPQMKVIFMAMICYKDDTGLVRQTSTWRTLDTRSLRFLPSDDLSCEYSD